MKTESWKYTNINKWLEREYETPDMGAPKIIHVPKNTILEKPIYITATAENLTNSTLLSTRYIITLEENSSATIVQVFQAEQADNYWRKQTTEISLAANAQLNYYQVQTESETSLHTHTITVEQARDSQFNSFTLDNGGGIVRTDLNTKLQAENARCQLHGIYLVKNKQHVDNHTNIEHLSPHTQSTELYKGIIADQARAVFNGRVYVAPHAQKVISEQHNKNLLLSKQTEIDTKPELEIYADDVQCAHGATVGQLDPDAIFYITTRGMSEDVAKQLLTQGFAREMLDYINNPEIKQLFNQQLEGFVV
jgi:Fe-S cluster assembly protein SufD